MSYYGRDPARLGGQPPPPQQQMARASHPPPADGMFPVYQIDFTAVASGKRIASTKRRVRWRFGFTNQDAISAGQTGTACRGEEHDITLIWSITSGKRLLLADGQEVHFSVSRSQLFEFSWTMTGNHVLKVIANASPPLNVGPGFRQYDFFIDGRSFFSLPKVFRLGLRGGGVGGPPMGGMSMAGGGSGPRRQMSINNIAAIEAPHNVDEEQAYLQAAIKQSLADAPAVPAGKDYGDLLDFSDPEPVSAMVPSQMANGANQYAVPGAGGPIPYSPAPFAPAPQPMATDMNTGFASPPPAFAPMPGPVPAPSPYGQPVPQPAQPAPAADPFGMPPPAPGSPPPAADQSAPGQLSMFSAPAPTKAANADQAYQNMANLNDFNLVSKTEQAANNPFAPAPAPVQTLGAMKVTGGGTGVPKTSVMNAPPPGAMVATQAQNGNQWGMGGAGAGVGAPPPSMGMYGSPPPVQQQQQPYGVTSPYGQMPQQTPPMYGMQQQQQPQQQQPPMMQQQQQQQQPPPQYGAPPPFQQQY